VKLVPEAITFFRHQSYGAAISDVAVARLMEVVPVLEEAAVASTSRSA
jgi:hypothetical protein